MNLNLFIAKKVGGNGTIACISVAISILVMFVAIAISEGFRKEIGEKAVGFSGDILFTVPGQDYTTDRWPLNSDLSYLPQIRELPELKSVNKVAYKPGMAKTEDNVHGVLFKGVDSLYQFDFFAKNLIEGTLPDFSGSKISNQILISARLAQILGYQVGDRMTAYFIDDNVKARRFDISGIYSARLEDMDEKLVLADIRHIQRLNGWDESQTSCLELFLDGASIDDGRRMAVTAKIDDVIYNSDNDGDASVIVREIDDVYRHLFDWLQLLDMNVLIVLILMIVVAGFNMISGLLIILFEKISMIGLMKALGMRNKALCKIFVYKASFIVLKGMVIGNAIAITLTMIQKYFKVIKLDPSNYFVDHVPVEVDVWTMVVLNIASFVLMMLIMIIPSMFISKVSPDKTIKVN